MDVLYEVNNVIREIEHEMAKNTEEQSFLLEQMENELVWGSLKDLEEENLDLRTNLSRIKRTLQHYLEENNKLVTENEISKQRVTQLELGLEESSREVERLTTENARLMEFQEQETVNGTAWQQEEIRAFLEMNDQEMEQMLKGAQEDIDEKNKVITQLKKWVETLEKDREIAEFVLNQHNKTEIEHMQLKKHVETLEKKCKQAFEEVEKTKLNLKVIEWREKTQAEELVDTKEDLEKMTRDAVEKQNKITWLFSRNQEMEGALAKLAFITVVAKLFHEGAENKLLIEKENQILQLKFDMAEQEAERRDMTERHEGKIATLVEQIGSLKKMTESHESENAVLVERMETMQKELNKSEELVGNLRGQLSDAKKISTCTSEKISGLTDEIQRVKDNNVELRKVILGRESDYAAIFEKKSSLQQDLNISKELTKSLRMEVSILKQELAKKAEENQQLNLKLREGNVERNEEIQRLKFKLREEEDEKENEIQRLKQKLRKSREMEESQEDAIQRLKIELRKQEVQKEEEELRRRKSRLAEMALPNERDENARMFDVSLKFKDLEEALNRVGIGMRQTSLTKDQERQLKGSLFGKGKGKRAKAQNRILATETHNSCGYPKEEHGILTSDEFFSEIAGSNLSETLGIDEP